MFRRIARGLSLSLLLCHLAGGCCSTPERVVVVCCDPSRGCLEKAGQTQPEFLPGPAPTLPALPAQAEPLLLPSLPNQGVKQPAASRTLVTTMNPPVVCSRWKQVQDSAPVSSAEPAPLRTASATRPAQLQSLRLQFPLLPALDTEAEFVLGPDGQAMSLAEMWKLAVRTTPAIQEAVAAVETARQAAAQVTRDAGSNLVQIQTLNGSREGLEQMLNNTEKVQRARTEAVMDLHRAQAALRQKQTELAAEVRGHFLEVLLVQEEVRTGHELAGVAVDTYNQQVERLRQGTLVPAEELAHLRDLATQGHTHLGEVRKQHEGIWQKLAASIGMPEMPPMELSGRCREGNNVWAAELQLDNEAPQLPPQLPPLSKDKLPPLASAPPDKNQVLAPETRPAGEPELPPRDAPPAESRVAPIPATLPVAKPLDKIPPLSSLLLPATSRALVPPAPATRPETQQASLLTPMAPLGVDVRLLEPPPELPRNLGLGTSR